IRQGTVILVGRSQSSKELEQWLSNFQSTGLEVIYRSLDVTDREAVQQCVVDIKEDYGELNGIIHSAGITRDNFIIQKTTTEFNQVLLPKVTGIVQLDEATRDCHLDFFVTFSSIASVMGN